MWDIEGILLDTKGYEQRAVERGQLPAGTPIHHMGIRLTIDDEFVIHIAETEMVTTPFNECREARDPVRGLVGLKIGSGWRKLINDAMGGDRGCTHLRELLYGMGTAAFQTVGRYRAHERRSAGLPEPVQLKPLPPLGECLGWSLEGGPVQRHYPQFFQSVPDNARLVAKE